MATANNWILSGELRPTDVGKPQSSQAETVSVVTILEAKVTGDLVKWLGHCCSHGEEATDGHNWNNRAISSRSCFGLTNAETRTPRWTSLLATCCGLR